MQLHCLLLSCQLFFVTNPPPPHQKKQEIRRSGKFTTFAYIYVSLRWYSRLWIFVLKNNCMFRAALFLGEGALVVEQRVGFIFVFV